MKKSVSLCLLSILVAMFIAFGAFLNPVQAQDPTPQTPCCLWLENTDPPTPYELTTLELPQRDSTDVYLVKFENSCLLDPGTHISLDVKVYRDGVLLTGDLNTYATLEMETYYGDLHYLGSPLVPSANGTIDYPGANGQWVGTYPLNDVYALDYFHLHFFTSTTTRLKVKWRYVGNYKIEVSLIGRVNGTEWTSFYYNAEQNLSIGGHQSQWHEVLATATLEKIHTGVKDTAICAGGFFTYGNPALTFDTSVVGYLVPFYNTVCSDILDRLDTLNLTVYPVVPVPTQGVADVDYCLNDPTVALAVMPDDGYTLEWSLDNGANFDMFVNPIPSSAYVGTSTFLVRQVRIDTIYNTECRGDAATIIVTVHALPDAPQVTTPVEYCVGASASALSAVASGEGYSLQWSINDTNFSTIPAPRPTTTAAGTQLYYVRQKNNTTGCIGASSSITVTVFALPIVTATADPDTICVGQSSELTAEGADSYIWNQGLGSGASFTVTPLATTVYTVTGTEDHNLVSCSSTATATVTVNPLPVVSNVTLQYSVGATAGGDYENVGGTFSEGFSMCIDPTLENSFYHIDINTLTSSLALKENTLNGFTLDQTVLPASWSTYWAAKGVTAAADASTWQGVMWPIINGTNPIFYIYYDGSDYQMIDGLTYQASGTMIPLRVSPDYPEFNYTYSGTVTANTGCVSEPFDVNMSFKHIIVPTITGDEVVCAGSSATYTTESGMEDYSWEIVGGTGTSTTNSIDVTWGTGATGSVKVHYTDPTGFACASLPTTKGVTINPTPIVSFGFNGTEASATVNSFAYCYPTELNVTLFNEYVGVAPFSVTYHIDEGSDVTVTGLNVGDLIGSATLEVGTHHIIVTNILDANGCHASADFLEICQATVVINPLPDYTVTPASQQICYGQSATFTASGSYNFLWSPGGETTNAITVSPEVGPHTYTVMATNAVTGCQKETTVSLTVNPLPSVTYDFVPNDTICSGVDLTITANAGANMFYDWLISSGTGPILHITPLNFNHAPITNNYEIEVRDSITGCGLTDIVPVVIIPQQQPEITASASVICSDATATLDAGEWDAYVWSTGSHARTITVNTQGNYSVTITDENGCQGVDTFFLTVNQIPSIEISTNPEDATVCNGQTALIAAYAGSDISYLWDNGQTHASFTTPTLINNGVAPITYTYSVIATNNTTFCTATSSVTITVNPRPDAAIVTMTDTICAGDDLELTAEDNVNYTDPLITTTYLWSANTGYTTETPITVNPTSNITYALTATNSYGCVGSTSANIVVNPLPTPEIVGEEEICFDVTNNILALTHEYSAYNWSTDEITSTINAITEGTYFVTVVDVNGCEGSDDFELTVNPLPVFNLVVSDLNDSVCSGVTVTITANSSEPLNYEWSTGDTGDSFDTTLVNSGTYTFYVTATNVETGCVSTRSQSVTVNALPIADITSDATNDAICFGDDVTLTATGGVSYLWSTTSTDAVITVTPDETTTYYVTVTNSYGCTATSSITITVNPLPTVVIDMDPENGQICLGESIILTASGGASYVWSTGATTPSITVTPEISQSYSVIATTTFGCTASTSTYVNVNPIPVVELEVSPNDTICSGGSIHISVLNPAGLNFVWSNGSTNDYLDTILTAAGAHTFSVVGTDETTGCSKTSSITIYVNATPAPNLTIIHTTAAICVGSSVTLSGPAGFQYLWTPGAETTQSIEFTGTVAGQNIFSLTITDPVTHCQNSAFDTITVVGLPEVDIYAQGNEICLYKQLTLTASGGDSYAWSTGQVVNPITVSPLVNTTYKVTAYNTFGCSSVDSFSVIVNPLPNVTITPADTAVCYGQSVQLTASGADTYSWTENPVVVTPERDTTYTVIGTDENGCTKTASASIIVNPIPTITITAGPNDTICLGGTLTLTAEGGANMNYEWSTGETTSSIDTVFSIAGDHTYSVIGTNSITNCVSSATLEITVLSLPTPQVMITPSEPAICAGGNVELTGPDGFGYLWSNNATTQSITVSPLTNTTYYLTITDLATSCQNSSSVLVTVNPLPTITFTTVPNDTICSGTPITITANAGPNKRYNWLLTSQTGPILHATPLNNDSHPVTAIFVVEATDTITGCVAKDTQSVVVMPLPHPVITANNDTICAGQTATLDAGAGYMFYRWNIGDSTTRTISVTTTGTYTVTITDMYECEADTSFFVQVNPVPVIVLTPTPNDTVCNGDNIQIQANAGGGMTYLWSTGGTSNIITLTNMTNTTDNPINYYYTVTVTNTATGCTASATQTIVVNPTPIASIITLTDEICYGDSIRLTADDAREYSVTTTYEWSWAGSTATYITLYNLPVGGNIFGLTATNSYGCENSTQVTITVHPTYNEEESETICSSELPYTWRGNTFEVGTVSDDYTFNEQTIHGCDSIVTLHLTVNPSYTHTDEVTICDNDLPYEYGDSSFTAAGTYPVHFTLATGCDSLVTLTLNVNPTYDLTDEVTICDNELPYEYGDSSFTAAGTYPVHFTLGTGCDSLVTLTLNVNPTYSHTDEVTICSNELPYEYGDSSFTASGIYPVHFTLATGCDSLVTLTLTVNPSYIHTDVVTICSYDLPYAYGDSLFTAEGIYPVHFTLGTGCDSLVTLTLNVNPAYSHTDEVTICDNDLPYAYGDSSFTAAGTYPVYFTLGTGCDSLVTLTLNVNPTYSHTDEVTICDNDLPYAYGDSSFTAAGIYPVHFTLGTGCDSLVTLTLNVNPTYSHTNEVTICDNYLPYAYGDSSFTAAGIYPVHFTLATGCDSLVTLTLNVNPTYSHTDEVSICSNDLPYAYGDSTFIAAGTYPVHFTLATGCDSLVTLTLTVNPIPDATITATDDTICLNQSVTLSVAASTSYLWSNDSTTQSIVVTPATAGDFTYSVVVTNAFSCTSTDDILIHVDTLPVVTITGDDRACEGPILLTATPGFANYNWNGDDSLLVNTFSATVTDSVVVIVTDGNGCQSADTHSVVISATPYMDIYVENFSTGVNTYTDEAVVGGATNFDIVVNTCENLENRRVSIEFKVYRNDTLISTNMTPYITNNNSISYDVDNTNSDQAYFMSAIDKYYDISAIGSIPAGELNSPLTDRTYRLTWGGSNYEFEWFWLHFLDDRPISVQVANWTEPGEYRFEYTLVERQATDNWGLPYLAPNYEIGGHNANAIIATLAFRTITVTVSGAAEGFFPMTTIDRPVVPAVDVQHQAATLDIYPNPNSNRVVNLKLTNLEGKTIVNIINMSGKVVESHELNLSSKDQSIFTYSLDDYAQGVYFVTIINNDAVLTKKLIIQK